MKAAGGPAVPLVHGPDLAAHLNDVGADAATRAFALALGRDGLAPIDLGPEVLPLCDEAAADMAPWLARPGVRRVQDLWRRSRAVKALAGWPPVLRMLEQTYGRRPFAFQTLNFGRGSEQMVHADSMHFQSDPPGFMCGVWIALEAIAPTAGPLVYHPGSHVLPYPDDPAAGGRGLDEGAFVTKLGERVATAGWPRREATPRKGEAVVWAANLAHGGAAIADPASTRRSLVIHYFFEGCAYHTPSATGFDPDRRRLRLPVDVATGRWVWPRRDGRRLAVRPQQVALQLSRALTRKVHAL